MTEPLRPGDRVHFLESMIVHLDDSIFTGRSASVGRGDTITLTDAVLRANVDSNGDSWLDLVDDEDRQVERYGSPVFGRGPWPADEPKLVPGSVEWAIARERAHAVASAEPDEEERRRALRTVEREFGPQTTSTTTALYAGDPQIAERRAAAARADGR